MSSIDLLVAVVTPEGTTLIVSPERTATVT
jgi:hypothetical protein